MAAFLTNIGTVVTQGITWLGSVTSALLGESGALNDLVPFIALGIGVGIIGLGVKYVRSFIKFG